MSLPNSTNLSTLDYIYLGAPFVQVGAKSGINLNSLDYIYLGAPFWAVSPSGTTNIASWDSCLYSNINSILGVSMTNVLNIDGLT
jgi:hypothetical protein